MLHDLIIKNGKVIDGSGLPGFHGDVAVSGGRIVEVGKVSGEARQVLNADGLVVAPGIIDNHTHYDAQVTWDPLCTYSCYHGITTVVMGHCAVRRYVMGEDSQERHATDDEIAKMKTIVREGLEAGAVGISFERNLRHFDWNGRLAPTNLASEEEIFAVAGVADEVG